MAGHFHNRAFERNNRARKALHDRLLREEIGDEDYQKLVSGTDDRPFKWFGLAFVLVLAVVFFGMTWLGF